MGFRLFPLFTVFLLPLSTALGEMRVEITPPELVNVGGVLNDLISQQEINALVSEPLDLYESQIEDQLSGALGKPALYQGLADAVALPLLALSRPVWHGARFSLALGAGAGVQADSLDPAVWADRMQTLRPEVDYRFGASAQPLSVTATWTVVPGEWSWALGVFGAWSQVHYDPVTLVTSAVGAATHLGYHPRGVDWGLLRWSGVTLSLGGGRAQNRFDSEVSVTLPTREIPLDLTYLSNAGTVAVTATPRFQISLDNQGAFWPIQASTEFALGPIFRLGASVGGVWAYGTSTLSLQGRNPVHIATIPGSVPQPVYERFLGDTAWVDVEGSQSDAVGPWWQPFAGVSASWAMGAFRFSVPMTYRHPGGLAVSVVWGVSL